jgi:Tfp pilus assembly major pilin PilA
VQTRGYFVSDQAENETTKQIIDNFKAANEAKAKLEGKMKALGDCFAALARTLQNPSSHVFYVDESDNITVGQPNGEIRRAVARATPTQINWKDLCETLRGYNQATEDRKNGASILKSLGIPVAE